MEVVNDTPAAEEVSAPPSEMTQHRARKDHENRKKLALHGDRLQRFCKSRKLQVFIFGEGLEPGTVSMGGYYSNALIRSLVFNLANDYGPILDSTLAEFKEMLKKANPEQEAQVVDAEVVEPQNPIVDGDDTGASVEGTQ